MNRYQPIKNDIHLRKCWQIWTTAIHTSQALGLQPVQDSATTSCGDLAHARLANLVACQIQIVNMMLTYAFNILEQSRILATGSFTNQNWQLAIDLFATQESRKHILCWSMLHALSNNSHFLIAKRHALVHAAKNQLWGVKDLWSRRMVSQHSCYLATECLFHNTWSACHQHPIDIQKDQTHRGHMARHCQDAVGPEKVPQLFGHFQSWITTWHRARCHSWTRCFIARHSRISPWNHPNVKWCQVEAEAYKYH